MVDLPRELLPHFERAPRKSRVDLVGAIGHADDPGLAAGAGAAAAGTVRVDDFDLSPALQQVIGGPGPEDSGADNDHAAGFGPGHSHAGEAGERSDACGLDEFPTR